MRSTTTNSGADSKGVVVRLGRWEVEGQSYLLLVAGAVGCVVVFILTYKAPFIWRAAAALAPIVAAVLWIRFFVFGRPPHFVGDWFEGLLAGENFKVRLHRRLRVMHPRIEQGDLQERSAS